MAGNRHANFKAEVFTAPVTFDYEKVDGTVVEFECAPMVAGDVLLEFFAALALPNDAVQSQATQRLFRAAFVRDCPKCDGTGKVENPAPEADAPDVVDCAECAGMGDDISRFMQWKQFASERRNGLTLTTQINIAKHLAWEYGSATPTRVASGSQPGATPTTDGSEDTSDSPA